MYELMFDLAVVSLFMVFLIFALRQRERYFQYYPQNWRALTLGGILLVLAGASNLVSTLSQQRAAFDPRWQQILRATGIIGYAAGGSLVALGLGRWCRSLVRTKDSAMRRLRQLACLKALLSVADRQKELEEMLRGALSQLMNVMGYRIGVIYKPTFRSTGMTLAAHSGVSVKNLFALYELHLKNPWYQESKKSQKVAVTTNVRSLPEYQTVFSDTDGIRSLACVPIKCRGKVLGLVGLYDTKADRFSYQEIQFLSSVGETLGLAAKRSLASDSNKRRKEYISAVENLLKISEEFDSLEDAFPRISIQLKRIVEFDHFSLILAGAAAQDMKSISIGDSGGILVESKADRTAAGEPIHKVMQSGEVRIDRNIESCDSSEGTLLKACGIKSRMVVPLWWKSSICGAMSLGHKTETFYSVGDAKWLGLFALTLSEVIMRNRLKESLQRERSWSRSLRDFDRRLAGDEELKRLVGDAASSLVQDLPRSFARISLLSKERNQLINCAIHQIRSEGIDLRREARFPLDELPWHRLALQAEKPMLINQDDPESLMSRKESRLIMDQRINSALLVPLMLYDKPVGIVSVGEMRSWDRQPLTKEDLDFVKHKADQLSLALKGALLQRSNQRLNERLKRSEGSGECRAGGQLELSDLSYQIANPLTSIRGSAELLRLREPDLSPDSLRYLNNIENGVDRIKTSVEHFLSSAAVDAESQEERPHQQAVLG